MQRRIKVSITPVVAASIAVNTTTARLGSGATALDVGGAYSSKAEQTSTITTKATGQAQGTTSPSARRWARRLPSTTSPPPSSAISTPATASNSVRSRIPR